ncbi:MAG: DUF459 domain-containing protein [Pseudolabrys sp.]|nr:DUF459 domain-containing protein [Pseudolabrys sp.]MDP2294973.1 DUF459 domain-containing protein [Pseudolabrys sp.]
MTRKYRFLQRLAVVAVVGVAECAAIGLALTGAAQAQDYPFLSRQRQPRGDGFFQQLFGPSNRRQEEREYRYQLQAPADHSRAPAVRKDSKDQIEPTTSIVVMGDGMADWLAYGLEDAFGDMPEVGVVRKSKAHSGLLRYDAKNDLDWWHAARDLLAQEKPNYVIMMLGVSDRHNMRAQDIAKEADKKADAKDPKDQAANPADQSNQEAEDSEQSIVAPEPSGKRGGSLEFRGDQWEKIYTRRIDDTIAALRSKGVPVFWVGLPSIRGARSTSDAVYLNDLYRARAEKAGAVYIDVWDGFVDEGGKYTNFGPDYEGQMRRLRSGDGVYFTKYGARKLAHYVEREVRRYMSNRGPVALPSGPMGPVPADGMPTARPLAGPVVPLTLTSGNSEVLLGGSGAAASRADATAASVLVKGDAIAAPSGRADDFLWPRGTVAPPPAPPPVAAVPPAAASASVAAPAVAKPELVKPELVKPAPGAEPRARPAPPATAARPAPQPRPVEARPRAADNAPRPSQPVRPRNDGPFGANGPFGWMR